MKIKKTRKGYKADVSEWWEWLTVAIGLACFCAWLAYQIGGNL